MKTLQLGIIGCGFWANFQVAGWLELPEVQIVAVCDRDQAKAQALAAKFGINKVYHDAAEMLNKEALDCVDIITNVETHRTFVEMVAARGISVICQKPMGQTLDEAYNMVKFCHERKVKFFVHENFRWQHQLRRVKAALDSGVIGKVFKARITFCSAFDVYKNQPFLADTEHFVLTDIGSHFLDEARYLFGEAKSLYCQTHSVNPRIKGEDAAEVFLKMQNGVSCYVEMSYASILEYDMFPETHLLIEGEAGSIHLDRHYTLKITTRNGTTQEDVQAPVYTWADPTYAVFHASIVDCNRDILQDLQGIKTAETTGTDNLKTVALVWASYDSAAKNEVIYF
ncbi:MAG: Gfo/Idh/MocA family protein [Saprospiraceae bacterium]